MAFENESELLSYIVAKGCVPGQRLPSINQLARELGISTSKLREQLEVARALELVEVRPKTGIRTLGYSFLPCLRTSLRLALALDANHFTSFGILRSSIEASFWHQAVRLLLPEDIAALKRFVERAWEQLHGSPVQIPHSEHRDLHLTIYSRLENPFVQGILEAYWDAYEIVGLNVYTDYSYLEEIWEYHQQMVEAIVQGNFDEGYRALIDHIGFLQHRPELSHFSHTTRSEAGGDDDSVREGVGIDGKNA
jgi:DNA-binding FadR family transcriptional regulator